MNLASRVGLKPHLDRSQRQTLIWVSHFGYGAAAGAPYGPVARRLPVPAWLAGPLYGLLVWAGSYLGLVPAMKMPEAAKDQPWQRNALMIGAHLVWGTALGLTLDALSPSDSDGEAGAE